MLQMKTENKKERIGSIDIAKGLAIFFVCWFHLASSSIPMVAGYLFSYIMGTFFFLSAYFYKPNQGYSYNVTKRLRQVVVPLLKFSAIIIVIYAVFNLIRGETVSVTQMFEAYKNNIFDPYSLTKISESVKIESNSYYNIVIPFWFLSRLFFSELIFFAIADWAISSLKRLIPTVVGLITITFLVQQFVGYHLPFQFEVCFAIAGLMLVGAYLKQKKIMDYIETQYKSIKYWIIVIVSIAIYTVLLILFQAVGKGLRLGRFASGEFHSWHVYPWLLTTLAGTYFFLVLCSFFDKIPGVSCAVKYLGKRSLFILCFHLLIGRIIQDLLNVPRNVQGQAESSNTLLRFFIMIATVIICCIVEYLLNMLKGYIKNRIKAKKTVEEDNVAVENIQKTEDKTNIVENI